MISTVTIFYKFQSNSEYNLDKRPIRESANLFILGGGGSSKEIGLMIMWVSQNPEFLSSTTEKQNSSSQYPA